jgi:hypothetical protein
MRFKRSITPFEAYELRTRILGMNEKWIYVEHRFFVKNRCKAAGIAKVVILDSKGKPLNPKLQLPNAEKEEDLKLGDLIAESEKLFGADN